MDAVNEKMPPYRVAGINEITLARSLSELCKVYSEIIEVSVDHNQFVTLEGFDEESNDFKLIVDPVSAKVLGDPIGKSDFIPWITALHRSLFLHETGRFIVGIISFLLLLITNKGKVIRSTNYKKKKD